MPLVSLHPPSASEEVLRSLYHQMVVQTCQDWEWIGSPPAGIQDARCHTHPSQGEIEIELEEGTEYAPQYIESCIERLAHADHSYLTGWFGWDPSRQEPLYWSSQQPTWSSSNRHPHLLPSGWFLREVSAISPSINPTCRGVCRRRTPCYGGATNAVEDSQGVLYHQIASNETTHTQAYFRLPLFLFQRYFPQFLGVLTTELRGSTSYQPSMPKTPLALITPTADRESLLEAAYRLLQAQTVREWNWYIGDTSYKSSSFFSTLRDPRVHYFHWPEILSIGEKRNRLVAAATESIIVHIDDDDYYAPQYLERVAHAMQSTDFFATTSWYAYDRQGGQTYYWLTAQPSSHYHVVDPLGAGKLTEWVAPPESPQKWGEAIQQMGSQGYGFTYAYKKSVWQASHFLPIDIKEDSHFLAEARHNQFSICTHQDQEGILVKIIHDQNVSCIYPQYRVPAFLVPRHLPAFSKWLHENGAPCI